MSTKYQSSNEVPDEVLVSRLKELSDAITRGRQSLHYEFTMRIPAECDRDADLVLSESAVRLDGMRLLLAESQARLAELEQAQARVAMLEEFVADAQQDAWRALDPDYVPPDVAGAMKSLLHRAATITQEVDPDDIEPSAWLLRKQAEAIRSEVSGYFKSNSGPPSLEAYLNWRANLIENEADEIERQSVEGEA